MPPFTLRVQNFKALHRLEWALEGVCLLVGPNGSGKTTALEALAFLRDALLFGLPSTLHRHDGLEGLRRLGSGDAVRIAIQVAQTSLGVSVAEDGGRVERGMDGAASADLERLLQRFRVYGKYRLEGLRSCDAGEGDDSSLTEDGRNVHAVLRRWRALPELHDRWAWVLSVLRRAFPGQLEDLDPANDFPLSRAADGLLVGLLHLVAVAGTEDGAVIALDLFERALHPHAIRTLLEAIRERAEEHGLTVILTTHSPVVMDAFRLELEQVYGMVPDQACLPMALDQRLDADFLAQHSVWEAVEQVESSGTEEVRCALSEVGGGGRKDLDLDR